jgi:hypothetical protein
MSGIISKLSAMTARHRRRQTLDALMGLDDHLLRDVGLARGIMVSIRSADGRPRGLYADFIADRLRRF